MIPEMIRNNFSNQQLLVQKMDLKLTALKLMQHDHEMYIGKFRVKDFFENANYEYARWDMKFQNNLEKQGYQRVLTEKRAQNFGEFIADRTNMSPATVYFNIRDGDKDKVIPKKIDNGLYTITIPPEVTLWTVDGQHRIEGMRSSTNWQTDLKVDIPFLLTIGLDKQKEIEQFLTINKTQGAVKTDLAEVAITDIIKRKPELETYYATKSNIIFKDIAFVKRAVEVMNTMNQDKDSCWYSRILLPNQKKTSHTAVSSKSFTDSLRDLMQEHQRRLKKSVPLVPFGPLVPEKIVPTLNNYWNAISKLLPDAFKEENICKYAIQQTIGTMSLHRLLYLILVNCNDAQKVMRLSMSEFKELLSVRNITTLQDWDREYDDKKFRVEVGMVGGGKTGGKWTRYGTNQKSFHMMANEMFSNITRHSKTWKKYAPKAKAS